MRRASSPLSRACLSLARMLGLCAAAHAAAPPGPAEFHAEVDLESLPTVLPPRLLHLGATHFREVREYYGALREARARLETLEQLPAVECTQMMLELQQAEYRLDTCTFSTSVPAHAGHARAVWYWNNHVRYLAPSQAGTIAGSIGLPFLEACLGWTARPWSEANQADLLSLASVDSFEGSWDLNGSLVDAVVGADDTTATKLRALGYRKVPAGWSGEPPDFYLRPGFELGAEREGATFVPLPPPGSTCAAYPTRKPAPDTALYPGGVDGDQVCTLCPCSRMATVSSSIQDLTSGACRSIAGNGKRVTFEWHPASTRIASNATDLYFPALQGAGQGQAIQEGASSYQVCRVGGPSRHAGLTTPEGECSTSSERHSRNNMRPPSPAPPPRSPRHPHRGKHLPSGIDIWRPLDMLLAASNESKHEEERRSNTRTARQQP